MEKEFYLKVKFPEGKEMNHLKLEELIYFAVKAELGLEKDDFETLNVTCGGLKAYFK